MKSPVIGFIFEVGEENNNLFEGINKENIIVNLYYEKDTWSEEKKWWIGFMDASLLTVKIYNPESKTVYTAKGRDMVDLSDFKGYSSTIKIFKDKSTMITLTSKENIEIMNTQCIIFCCLNPPSCLLWS